jgi:hypothetical protein
MRHVEGLALVTVAIVAFRYVWFNYVFDVDTEYSLGIRLFRAVRDVALGEMLIAAMFFGMNFLLDGPIGRP